MSSCVNNNTLQSALVEIKCQICRRLFRTDKGLNIHLRSCKVKNKSNSSIVLEAVNQSSLEATISMSIWGSHDVTDLTQIVNSAYDEIVFWRRNIFKLPSGVAGKKYIKESTKLIESWNSATTLGEISLKMLMLMPTLLLQKPSRKSNSKQHSEYLNKRLNLWQNGNFDELLREGRAIQKTFKSSMKKDESPEHISKTFTKLMLQGKVQAALRLLDKGETAGVAVVNDETLKILRELHPDSKPACEQVLMQGEIPYFDPIIFSNIDEGSIAKAAMRTRGAAGPSGMDAEGWRRILVSKNYGATGKDIRIAFAKMTRALCTREVTSSESTSSLEAYTACRLIPLQKKPTGVRPIGIGEVTRRIIGKAIIQEIKPELAECAGSLQLCAGQKSGCEAAAHAMREIFQEEETDAILLVDASNAFNSLNREAMLHDIRYLCPPLATYVRNCYRNPSRLYIAGGGEISSAEGSTQGDPSAMPAYAIGILPLLTMLKPSENPEGMKHVAYADDIGGGSTLEKLRAWWDSCVLNGPALGYYPKSSKSWLIVKENQLENSQRIFAGTGIKITTEGKKYLGGFIGKDTAAIEYVNDLVDSWIKQLDELVNIAKSEPQVAYTAFTAGFIHKMTYFIRTIPNLQDTMKRIDEKIDKEFIPVITEGHICNSNERSLLSLPVRMGV